MKIDKKGEGRGMQEELRERDRGERTMPCCIFIRAVFESPWEWKHNVDTVHHARTTCHLITLSRPFLLFLFPSSFCLS